MTSIGELCLIGVGVVGVLMFAKGEKFLGIVLMAGSFAIALYFMGVLGR